MWELAHRTADQDAAGVEATRVLIEADTSAAAIEQLRAQLPADHLILTDRQAPAA